MYLLHQKGEQHTLWTMQVIIPKSARVILRATEASTSGAAGNVLVSKRICSCSAWCWAGASALWSVFHKRRMSTKPQLCCAGQVSHTGHGESLSRACTMCSHHTCNHQVPCATITQLSWLGTTAAGLTGIPRQLPVAAGTSCTSPSRARALQLKKQLLVVNSMD